MKLTKKQIVLLLVVVGIIIGGFVIFGPKKTFQPKNTIVAKKGDVIQEVSVTGRVEPIHVVDLTFGKSGRIDTVGVSVGDTVSQGKLLASVDSGSALASLQEAQARLAELKRGSRPEEIAVKDASIAKYQQDLTNSYDGVLNTVNDAYTIADDAVHAKMTGIFSGFETSTYKFTYQICDSQLDINGIALRHTSEMELNTWSTEIAKFPNNPTNTELRDFLTTSNNHLVKIKNFLEGVNQTLTLGCNVSNTALDIYRSNVNLARTNIAAGISSVNSKRQVISSLSLSVAQANDELSLLKAGTASEVIAAQDARVLAAQNDLNKYYLTSPINGVVTKANAKVGELSNTAIPTFSIISNTSFEIKAQVPESDIAKVKVGDNAQVTLDAYGNDILFEGTVTAIDPAETIIENVPTYTVTLNFTKNDVRIKSGMTANIDIATGSKEGVLIVPQRAIISKAGQKFVTVVNKDNSLVDTPIVTGLRGSDGSTEIVSGINDGTIISIEPIQ